MIRPPDWRFASTLAALTLVGPLAIHLFLPAMPAVKLAFGISDAASGLMLSVTLFVVAFATLAYGSLSDRYGRRPLLLGGLAIFTLGSAISALAPSPELLLAGRAVQAVGAGCSGGLTRAIARDAYGTEGLVTVIAYLTMAYTLGPMIAPLAGGFLIDASGWRSVFWLAAVSGAMILVAAWRVLGETLPAEKRLAQQAGMLRDYARLFSSLRFNAYVLQSGFSSSTFLVMSTAATFLMSARLGRSASEFGIYFLLFPLGLFTGNLISSRLTKRFSIETMVLAGSCMNTAAVGVQSAALLAGHVSPLLLFLPGMIVTMGQGIALPNAQTGAIRVAPELAGTASGIGAFFQTFIGAVAVQIFTWFFDGSPGSAVLAIVTVSLLTLAMGVIPFLTKRTGRERPPRTGQPT